MKRQSEDGKNAIELIEEAFQLLRSAPFSALVAYYAGALPFILAFLYFWSDMSSGVLAEDRLLSGATILSLLFLWMKCWQAAFAGKLLARSVGTAEPRWDRARIVRTVVAQTILQPLGLFLLPISAAILFPLPWVFAFYQNAVVFGAGDEPDFKSVFRKSWRQMNVWPAQNYLVVLMLKLFGLFVFVNVIMAALGVPFLLKSLLGIETTFSRSWMAALNTTFFAAAFGLTYLCVDPLIKAVYVVRCFHGRSLESAEDLRAELRASVGSSRAVAAAACVLLGISLRIGSAAEAAKPPALPPSVTAPALERSITEVIQQREYTWRMPRDKVPANDLQLSWFDRIIKRAGEWIKEALKDVFETIMGWLRKLLQWIFQNKRPAAGSGFGVDWYSALRAVLILLCIALLIFGGMLLFRSWKQRRPADVLAAQPLPPQPDILDENTAADQLPEDGWLQMAREFMQAGELRLALRAYYLASLAHLAERNLIVIARHKSNRDYERELRRRAHAIPAMTGLFSENVSTFDRVWYGLHEVSAELLDTFAGNVSRIKNPVS